MDPNANRSEMNSRVHKDPKECLEAFREWCGKRKCRGCPARSKRQGEGICYINWQFLPSDLK